MRADLPSATSVMIALKPAASCSSTSRAADPGRSYGYFEARDLVRVGARLTMVEFLAVVLVIPFHSPLIGIQ